MNYPSFPSVTRGRSFLDAFADAFTPPEYLELYEPEPIKDLYIGQIRDGDNIRKYFNTAVGAETDKVKAIIKALEQE